MIRILSKAFIACLFIAGIHSELQAQTDCTTATSLSFCTATTASLSGASNLSNPTSCGGTTAYGKWYSFTATATTASISASSIGSNASSNSPYFQVFSTNCNSGSSIACASASSGLALSNLTVGGSYFLRVFTLTQVTGNVNNGKLIFSVTSSPENDEPSDATFISTYSSLTTTSGTLASATSSASITGTCATQGPDVYFKFVPESPYPSVTVNTLAGNLTTSNTYVQLLSGTPGNFTNISCTATSSSITTTSTPVTIGDTLYIRVFSNATTSCTNTFKVGVTETLPTNLQGGRRPEIFRETILSPANILNDPWEVTYGPDSMLYITEAKGYKVYQMNPTTGIKTTILDVGYKSTWLPLADTAFDVQFSSSQNPWPQGGFAGLALHPRFLADSAPKNYIYVSYVHKYNGSLANNYGVLFTNRVVRFTYDPSTKKLGSPVSLCDTLPGSNDHNSQRMIIAPVNGVDYLFYAQGDMGAGQFSNVNRTIHAQDSKFYEGKILRFNLEEDLNETGLDPWIPNDNPFNGTTQSAVWVTGIRNNQGFAYAVINGTGRLYGSSHGPFSDDEVNIIKRGQNYGHPIVIGFSADGNYDGAKAGPSSSSLPAITTESAMRNSIGITYEDPIYSFYAAPKGTTSTTNSIQYIYNQVNTGNQNNSAWPSEGISGMEAYTSGLIPGWKNSLIQGCLKGGKVVRIILSAAGDTVSNQTDTVSYFRSVNRFRDIAISPNGRQIFTVIDKSSVTSGPTSGNPMVSACAGCVIKYDFLGYESDANGKSTIPTDIGISSAGTANTCTPATTITIDRNNANYWVPITGSDGKILAEINANGNVLGVVTTSVYLNSNGVREDYHKRLYLDRNLTITPATQPSSAVSIRLYITSAELTALANASNSLGINSGVSTASNLSIFKNSEGCKSSIVLGAMKITPSSVDSYGAGYVLQASISSFSSFYFASSANAVLPLDLVSFTGQFRKKDVLLQWTTEHERDLKQFEVERSLDATSFQQIGRVDARNTDTRQRYDFVDNNVIQLKQDFVYYRLKMLDKNGSFKYSNTVRVRIEHPAEISVYPNPAVDAVRLQLINVADQMVNIEVVNLQGSVVAARKATLNGGSVDLNVKSLANQFYIIRVTDLQGNLIQSARFEKIER